MAIPPYNSHRPSPTIHLHRPRSRDPRAKAIAMSEPRRPHDVLGPSAPLVPPLYQSAVYTLPDLDALDRVTDGEEAGFIYSRDGHPNAQHLAERLAALEGAEWGLVCASGMGAIVTMVLGHI